MLLKSGVSNTPLKLSSPMPTLPAVRSRRPLLPAICITLESAPPCCASNPPLLSSPVSTASMLNALKYPNRWSTW